MNSRLSSWAPSRFYRRAEWEANCREDLEVREQELGHGKQRRLKAQHLWDIPEPDTVSKSAQSAPSGYFQNPSMTRGHPAVISRTPVRHLITRPSSSKWLARPAITRRCLQNTDFVFSRSALPLKCRRRPPVTRRCLQNADFVFSRSALPLKCRRRPPVTQRCLQNTDFVFSRSALPLKCRRRPPVTRCCLQNVDFVFSRSALPLKCRRCPPVTRRCLQNADFVFSRSTLPLKRRRHHPVTRRYL
jgi:ribosomal protein S27E